MFSDDLNEEPDHDDQEDGSYEPSDELDEDSDDEDDDDSEASEFDLSDEDLEEDESGDGDSTDERGEDEQDARIVDLAVQRDEKQQILKDLVEESDKDSEKLFIQDKHLITGTTPVKKENNRNR